MLFRIRLETDAGRVHKLLQHVVVRLAGTDRVTTKHDAMLPGARNACVARSVVRDRLVARDAVAQQIEFRQTVPSILEPVAMKLPLAARRAHKHGGGLFALLERFRHQLTVVRILGKHVGGRLLHLDAHLVAQRRLHGLGQLAARALQPLRCAHADVAVMTSAERHMQQRLVGVHVKVVERVRLRERRVEVGHEQVDGRGVQRGAGVRFGGWRRWWRRRRGGHLRVLTMMMTAEDTSGIAEMSRTHTVQGQNARLRTASFCRCRTPVCETRFTNLHASHLVCADAGGKMFLQPCEELLLHARASGAGGSMSSGGAGGGASSCGGAAVLAGSCCEAKKIERTGVKMI